MKFEKISYGQWYTDTSGIEVEYNDIKLPKRATKGSAGYDFFSLHGFELKPRQTILVPTGIKVQLDCDKVLVMVPRSGHGFKYKVQLQNTVGIIDCDYYNNKKNEGHIWVKLYNDSPDGETLVVKSGEAFCQGIIMQYFTVEGDNEDNVREGGFGSTTQH